MSMTTPTPGQPLSEADVSLLQPGDWLRDSARRLCRFDHLMRPDYIWARIGQGSSCGGGVGTFTFLGRPDQDGWMQANGSCPKGLPLDLMIDARRDNKVMGPYRVSAFNWDLWCDWRPHAPVSRPAGEGEREAVAWPVVTDQWAETYCELTGRDPDGQQVTFVDGGTVTTFRDMARREIEAMLCAAPKAAVRAIAALTPPAEPVSRPAGEGEREAVARIIDPRIVGMDFSNYTPDSWMGQAITKADAIISLLRPAAPDAGGGEDLAGKLKAIRDKFLFPTPDKDHTDYAVMTRCIAALQPGGER